MVSPQARREQVAFACERGLAERRACGLLDIARSTLSYKLRLPVKDRPMIEAMKALWSQYPRYGYRRIRIFLKRQGHARLAPGAPVVAPGRPAVAASPTEAAHPAAAHVRCRQPARTSSGLTTSSSTPAPTASSSNV